MNETITIIQMLLSYVGLALIAALIGLNMKLQLKREKTPKVKKLFGLNF